MSHIRLKGVNLHYKASAFCRRSFLSLMSGLFTGPRSRPGDIHALKDISLEISVGERIGLIGHNGAGKSTFLKAIAGLYPTSSGTVDVQGNIRSLFDLSLGFEPEATGRENILYRGLLLGQKPSYIKSIEQSIIDFAELDEFIDYPIKAYSTGMLVRLAFAISTAAGGDILLLDEVIGAGDAAFMVKAQKRIRDLIDDSKIVVLASHDCAALQSICERGLVFNCGRIIFDGAISEAINHYQRISGLLPQ
ncbi:MAG: ABC transporter ATP-binding protein [Pseudomonadota bacterium]